MSGVNKCRSHSLPRSVLEFRSIIPRYGLGRRMSTSLPVMPRHTHGPRPLHGGRDGHEIAMHCGLHICLHCERRKGYVLRAVTDTMWWRRMAFLCLSFFFLLWFFVFFFFLCPFLIIFFFSQGFNLPRGNHTQTG